MCPGSIIFYAIALLGMIFFEEPVGSVPERFPALSAVSEALIMSGQLP
jgi:hypothetical protein